jgi:hypothetical protein
MSADPIKCTTIKFSWPVCYDCCIPTATVTAIFRHATPDVVKIDSYECQKCGRTLSWPRQRSGRNQFVFAFSGRDSVRQDGARSRNSAFKRLGRRRTTPTRVYGKCCDRKCCHSGRVGRIRRRCILERSERLSHYRPIEAFLRVLVVLSCRRHRVNRDLSSRLCARRFCECVRAFGRHSV